MSKLVRMEGTEVEVNIESRWELLAIGLGSSCPSSSTSHTTIEPVDATTDIIELVG
jgi:hypothetical protein